MLWVDSEIMLNKEDQVYIAKRRKLSTFWLIAGWLMLLLLIGLSAWLFIKTPHLINPWFVFEAFRANQVDVEIMEISTLILPIVTLILLLVVGCMIALGFVVFHNEQRYLAIIDKLNDET